MKFLIAVALLSVVSALPPRHGFDLLQHDDYRIDGPSSHPDKHHQVNLIKLVYKQLIERLNYLPEDDNEEEESVINDIVDTINIIGEIIHDKSIDGDDNGYYNRRPIQHPEHKGQEGDVPNKSPSSDSEVPPKQQDEVEKVPSSYGSKDEVISVVDNLPVGDDSESSESLVDVFEDDESDHDVLPFINQKDDKDDNHIIIAYNSNVAN